MFMLASSLTAKNLRFFRVMIALLVVDGIWCLLSLIFGHSPTALGWMSQNIVCIALLSMLIWLRPSGDGFTKWACSAVITIKMIADYYWYWNTFYFAA